MCVCGESTRPYACHVAPARLPLMSEGSVMSLSQQQTRMNDLNALKLTKTAAHTHINAYAKLCTHADTHMLTCRCTCMQRQTYKHACTHKRIHARTPKCIHAHTHKCIHKHMHTHTFSCTGMQITQILISTCTHMHAHKCMDKYMCARTCAYISAQICTHMCAHVLAHAHIRQKKKMDTHSPVHTGAHKGIQHEDTRMHARTYTCTHTHMQISTLLCAHPPKHILLKNMYTHTHAHVYTGTSKHAQTHVCTHAWTKACVHMFLDTGTHTTYTHTQTHSMCITHAHPSCLSCIKSMTHHSD